MKHKQSPFRIGSVYILMHSFRWSLLLVMAFGIFPTLQAQQRRTEQPWTEAQANDWYARQPWPVGADFLPSTAINELEMWQADTFDPAHHRPRTRLGRGHRHEHHARLPAQPPLGAGSEGLPAAHRHVPDHRVTSPHPARVCALRFLLGSRTPSSGRSIRPLPACTTPAGCRLPERRFWPTPRSIRASKATLRASSARSPTIRASSPGIYGTSLTTATIPRTCHGEPKNKNEIIAGLLPQVFAWARSAHPTQPLTSGLWHGDWTSLADNATSSPNPD